MARVRRARIAYESLRGWMPADDTVWSTTGLARVETPLVEPDCAAPGVRAGDTLLDVRTPRELRNGAINGSLHIPLSTLPAPLGEVPGGPVAVWCGSGTRASIASLLERAGRRQIVNGCAGWDADPERANPEPDAQDLSCRELFDLMAATG